MYRRLNTALFVFFTLALGFVIPVLANDTDAGTFSAGEVVLTYVAAILCSIAGGVLTWFVFPFTLAPLTMILKSPLGILGDRIVSTLVIVGFAFYLPYSHLKHKFAPAEDAGAVVPISLEGLNETSSPATPIPEKIATLTNNGSNSL